MSTTVDGEFSLAWAMTGSFFATSERPSDGMKLGIFVTASGDKWAALALETKDASSTLAVLAAHAHELVGEYPDPTAAFKAATDYVMAWSLRSPAELCPCPEIGKPATRSGTSANGSRRSPRRRTAG